MKPPSRSIIVSIEEVAAYRMDQNMVHRRGARGHGRRHASGCSRRVSVTRFTPPVHSMGERISFATAATEQRVPEGTLSTTTLFIMDRSSRSAVREEKVK